LSETVSSIYRIICAKNETNTSNSPNMAIVVQVKIASSRLTPFKM